MLGRAIQYPPWFECGITSHYRCGGGYWIARIPRAMTVYICAYAVERILLDAPQSHRTRETESTHVQAVRFSQSGIGSEHRGLSREEAVTDPDPAKKVAIVPGGAGGIGQALVRAFVP